MILGNKSDLAESRAISTERGKKVRGEMAPGQRGTWRAEGIWRSDRERVHVIVMETKIATSTMMLEGLRGMEGLKRGKLNTKWSTSLIVSMHSSYISCIIGG